MNINKNNCIIDIKIDYAKEAKAFRHFYNAVGYANVDYTYTAPTKKMYDYLSSFNNHFKYMRMHNILTAHGKGDYYRLYHDIPYGDPPGDGRYVDGGDSVVDISDGKLRFNWTAVDRIYDILIEHDICPIVETVFIPHCIQKSRKFWYIPNDFNMWGEILKEFIIHVQGRYGTNEVEDWYFEVWNEPDNRQGWVDDPSTFLALYDYMEHAIHSVNPNLKVGGPATKQWDEGYDIFKAFLEHCANGLNYATGQFGTRLDFISVHCKGGYPRSTYNPSTEVMFNSLDRYIDIVKEYPQFKDLEFFNDESDVVWNGNEGIWSESWFNFRNTHYFPGFVCKMVNAYCKIVEDRHDMNLSIVCSDNCHLQWERFLFSGNRSQFTPLNRYPSTDLIKKPVFNSYVLLSRLGSQRLPTKSKAEGFGRKFGVLPTKDGDILSIMVWNFEDGIEDHVNDRTIRLYIENTNIKGKYRLVHYRIDDEHSNAYSIWLKLGRPSSPSIDEIKMIREGEGLQLYEPVKDVALDGDMELEFYMPMHSVSLLLFLPFNIQKPCVPSCLNGRYEKGFNENPQVFLKWKPNKEKDFLYYRIWRQAKGQGDYEIISDNMSINTAVYIDMDVEKDCSYSYRVQALNASMVSSEFSDAIDIQIK